jgi:hypothetical protein
MGDERREALRYESHAQAVIEKTGNRGKLVDISVTGCRLEIDGPANVQNGEVYAFRIFPERDMGILPFTLEGRVAWMLQQGTTTALGLTVETSPVGKEFSRYVDCLAFYSQFRRASTR